MPILFHTKTNKKIDIFYRMERNAEWCHSRLQKEDTQKMCDWLVAFNLIGKIFHLALICLRTSIHKNRTQLVDGGDFQRRNKSATELAVGALIHVARPSSSPMDKWTGTAHFPFNGRASRTSAFVYWSENKSHCCYVLALRFFFFSLVPFTISMYSVNDAIKTNVTRQSFKIIIWKMLKEKKNVANFIQVTVSLR